MKKNKLWALSKKDAKNNVTLYWILHSTRCQSNRAIWLTIHVKWAPSTPKMKLTTIQLFIESCSLFWSLYLIINDATPFCTIPPVKKATVTKFRQFLLLIFLAKNGKVKNGNVATSFCTIPPVKKPLLQKSRQFFFYSDFSRKKPAKVPTAKTRWFLLQVISSVEQHSESRKLVSQEIDVKWQQSKS